MFQAFKSSGYYRGGLQHIANSGQDKQSKFPLPLNAATVTWDNYISPIALPGYLNPIITSINPVDPFRTTRISDETVFGIGDTLAKRHSYSTRSPFNSDSSLIMLSSNDPKVLNGTNYTLLGEADYGIVWSNTTPNKGFGSYDNVFEVNTISLQDFSLTTTQSKVFSDYSSMSLQGSNGNISNDDVHVALHGTKTGPSTDCWVVVYNIETDTIISETNMGFDISLVDWIGISQSGNYILIVFSSDGSGSTQGSKSYDQNMSLITHLTNKTSHGEVGVDTSGNDVFVSFADDVVGYELTMVRLDNGAKTGLFPSTSGTLHGGHISCRNTKRPGYAYVSTYGDPTDTNKAAPLENFSIRLDGGGANTIERWGKNNSELAWDGSHYYQQAHGCPSPDGKQFLFCSAWGDPTEEAKTYGYTFITKR